MYQVQIFNDEVGEWYGWAHEGGMSTTEREGQKWAKYVSRLYGWKTRCVKVRA